MKTLLDLLIHELSDLYSAEEQLIEALPKMAEAATSRELQEAFQQHLEETEGQVQRLEQCFELLGRELEKTRCAAMEGLIKEGSSIIKKQLPAAIKDAALIGAAQRVEHYEIAGYGTARSLAEELENTEVAALLAETLEEEANTDEILTEISHAINALAKEAA